MDHIHDLPPLMATHSNAFKLESEDADAPEAKTNFALLVEEIDDEDDDDDDDYEYENEEA